MPVRIFFITASLLLFLVSCQPSSSDSNGKIKDQDNATNAKRTIEEKDNIKLDKNDWKPIKRNYDPENELEKEILRLQDSIDRARYEERLNIEAMENGIAKMKAHGDKYTKHPRSSVYLLRAGDYAQGLRQFDEAIDIFKIILQKYPDSYEYVDALYYTGYIYDRQKKDYPEAVKYYNRFLDELPSHGLAPQVQAHLNRLQTIMQNEISK